MTATNERRGKLRRAWIVIMLLGMVSGLVACGWMHADEEDLKIEQAQYHTITPELVKVCADSTQPYTIIDVRSEYAYKQGHLAGSICIPEEEVRPGVEDRLPAKNSLVIVYCQDGSKSKQASMKLVSLGYTNVYDLGGINGWPYSLEQ